MIGTKKCVFDPASTSSPRRPFASIRTPALGVNQHPEHAASLGASTGTRTPGTKRSRSSYSRAIGVGPHDFKEPFGCANRQRPGDSSVVEAKILVPEVTF